MRNISPMPPSYRREPTADDTHMPLWRTKGGIVLIGFLVVVGFYLLTEHTAHVFGVLPYVLILACPLMHLFMRHGHGGHGGHDQADQRGSSQEDTR
jgi:peptidoglycan/LPS O-acetylase OafA/YrhL